MSKTNIVLLAAAAALAAVAALPPAAEAGIRCHDGYQLNKYGPIATPYCEDAHIAQVAREHGMRVSADAIRHNPSVKVEACLLVGTDIRVRNACAGYGLESGGRGRH